MFYERFCALCDAHHVKPTTVAKAIGLSKANATYWKKGSIPSQRNLQKLANYFGVPVEYLLGIHNSIAVDVRNPEAIQKAISKDETEKNKILIENLVQKIDEIPERYKDAAIQEIAAFAQFTLHKYKTMVPEESFIGP